MVGRIPSCGQMVLDSVHQGVQFSSGESPALNNQQALISTTAA